MAEVLVVGGGAAGLVAAWRAALGGRQVHLVERAPLLGGMASSFEVAGQRVDLGSHRLHPSIAPHLLHAVQSLLGDDLQRRTRNGRLRLCDRWVRFPLRVGDLVRRLPPSFAARAATAAAVRPLRRARPHADTYAEVVRSRFGQAVLDELYAPFARKLWGTAPDQLTGEVARRRISSTGAGSIVRHLAAGADAPARTFWYPKHGYGQIVEAIAQAAVDAGVTIDVGTSVRTLDARADAVTAMRDDGRAATYERVLWTAPLPSLIDVVDGAPADVRERGAALRHRAMVLVYGVVERPRYTPFDAHYLPDERTPISRLSEPKNYRNGPDPADRTVICAELPCSIDDEHWRATDDALAQVLTGCAERVELPPLSPAEVAVRRLARVYPVITEGTAEGLREVQQWAASLPRVVTFGRQALFVQDNLHHVMAMGWDAGELATQPTWDDHAWRDANRRYDAHVVED